MAREGLRYLQKYGKMFSKSRDYALFTERLLFNMVHSKLICLDDIDRAGDEISIKNVLGLVSQLRDQKNCKVVLILNDERLGKEKGNFDEHIEKAVDTIIDFAPSANEAAEIAIENSTKFHKMLAENCTKLNISNIRIIKKAQNFADRIDPEIYEIEERIKEQAIHSLVLFIASKYIRNDFPPLDFFRDYNDIHIKYMVDKNYRDEKHAEWLSVARDYGITKIDELDQVILEGIDRGYFDKDLLLSEAKKQEEKIRRADQETSMTAAWELYHDSFDNNEAEVIEGLESAFRANYRTVAPINLSGLATLFKDLGHAEKSRELVELYVENRDEPLSFWDLRADAFGAEVKDPDVRALFQRKFEQQIFIEPLDFRASLLRLARGEEPTRSDNLILAKATADDFYHVFKQLRGEDLRLAIKKALSFKRQTSSDNVTKAIAESVDDALDRIASESDINRRRVEQWRSGL